MKCDYCDNTEQVMTLADRVGKEPDVHICSSCWQAGVDATLDEVLKEAC